MADEPTLTVDGSLLVKGDITMGYIKNTTRAELCLPNLRWSSGKLQQAWQWEEREGFAVTDGGIEWRDVPTE
ncbi:MAG: hypothetical protein JWL86_2788 [Rhizobium sp.]|nr:hypothetical protein [Rhizobium sp.]